MSADLDRQVDGAIAAHRERNRATARARGGLSRLSERIDSAVRTERVEWIDRPELPAHKKLLTARYLHLYNRVFGNYAAFVDVLRPFLHPDRPTRVLELASGSGRFTLALAAAAEDLGVQLQLTGSDVVPAYVQQARSTAARAGADVAFEVIDAFELDQLQERYDVVFTANALHHFRPGQLARVLRGARSISSAFVGIDGRRSAWMLGLVSAGGLASGRWWIAHDAVVSARRFYAEDELALIAGLATEGQVRVHSRGRHHSVLTVRWS